MEGDIMLRATVCALALAAGVPVASAGELDRESPQAPTLAATAKATGPGGSELDRESPQDAHGWRWGGPRFYGGWGWGGFYPGPVSYFGFGSPFYYRPWGFYNFGYYPPFFPAYSYYYMPVGYGWWW
jgi:hypothetical protein